MKKTILLLSILWLPFLASAQSSEKSIDPFSVEYKNTIYTGIGIAGFGPNYTDTDIISYFYRNEFIHRLNKRFCVGAEIGFFNGQKTVSSLTTVVGQNITYYREYTDQVSVNFFSLTAYFDVINTRKSLLNLGAGYSVRSVKAMYVPFYFRGDILTYHNSIKGLDNGFVFHLGYGYRITPHLMPSVNVRVYTKGSYVSIFSTAGVGISYLF